MTDPHISPDIKTSPNGHPDRTAPSPRAHLVLAAACIAQVMVVLDVSVVNVALPSIASDLGFAPGGLSWVVNAYTLVFGGLLLLGGRFADLVGHRVAMLWGLALFGVASVIGGLAQTPGQLIAARAGQGLAGALLAPLSLAVIMVAFPSGKARSRAVGIWAMVAAAGSALGVLLGGLLTDWLSWRWVLFVNVPIVALGLSVAWVSLRTPTTPLLKRLDVPGTCLSTVTVTALANGLIQAGEHGWGASSAVLSFGIAVVTGVVFVVWELRAAAEPLVRFGVFRERSVWVANLVVLFIGAATVAGFYFASLFLQNVLHYSPLRAGAAFLPFCLGTITGSMLSGHLTARLGTRTVLATGLALGALGMTLFGLMDETSTFLNGFLLPSVVASVGVGLCMVSNTTLATSAAAAHEAGLISGLVNAARQIGGSLGLAILTAVAATHGGSPSSAADRTQQLVDGYERAFFVTAVFCAVAALIAALFAPRRARRGPRPLPSRSPSRSRSAFGLRGRRGSVSVSALEGVASREAEAPDRLAEGVFPLRGQGGVRGERVRAPRGSRWLWRGADWGALYGSPRTLR
ncbi:EmrB/QacA subfamily drug resistance transporter [Streptomyces sp. PsTaAH-137]|nr:DHA2 family efflux MFS transporter permease subunit [Streptomyces sp. SID8367]RAJ85071.1 EmrB/QacA subfamily drug resistance transporter [Streptomyces sp. PsTaAH-137]